MVEHEHFVTLSLQLPSPFKNFAGQFFGPKKINSDFMAHCYRELAHEQWKLLLDDEFLQAYEHGIVIECCDGVTRRIYPRIFTYSADYPEKYVSTNNLLVRFVNGN